MNLPEIYSYEERAIDTVVSVINRAQEMVGNRQTLRQLAGTRNYYACPPKVPLTSLGVPLAVTSEKLIANTIEKKWFLTKTFKYLLKYKGSSRDECMQFFYFEVDNALATHQLCVSMGDGITYHQVDNALATLQMLRLSTGDGITYHQAIFSQPSPAYPVPQATASVFFRVEDKLIGPPETRGKQKIYYRIEGHHSDHDIRYVLLPADWLLGVIVMKIKLFKKIESYNVF